MIDKKVNNPTNAETEINLEIDGVKSIVNIISQYGYSKFYAYKKMFLNEVYFQSNIPSFFTPKKWLTLQDLTECKNDLLYSINTITYYQNPQRPAKYLNLITNNYFEKNNNFNNFIKNMHIYNQGENIHSLHYNAMSSDKIEFNYFKNLTNLTIGVFYNQNIINLPESLKKLKICNIIHDNKRELAQPNHWTKLENAKLYKLIYINNLVNLEKLDIDCNGPLNIIDISSCKKLEDLRINLYNVEDIHTIDFSSFPQSIKNITITYRNCAYFEKTPLILLQSSKNIASKHNNYCDGKYTTEEIDIEIDLSYLKSLENATVYGIDYDEPDKDSKYKIKQTIKIKSIKSPNGSI